MPELSYQQPGLTLKKPGTGASAKQVRDLQRHLRELGYLRRGIDGAFGSGTEGAVMSLQYDLLNNTGGGSDGAAPVGVKSYNKNRVAAVTGEVDQGLAACIADMLEDEGFARLPKSDDPIAENNSIPEKIGKLPGNKMPGPFLLSVFMRESNLKQFNEPRAGDDDTYVMVGLDRNKPGQQHVITSRGYGVGQFTLFHHPPSAAEVDDIMSDVGKNLEKAADELREKFDGFVNGPTSGTQADDRLREAGNGPLRLCKFDEDDPKYMKDCKNCAVAAGIQDIKEGDTEWFAGSSGKYKSTQYYNLDKPEFRTVPIRKNFECDWPYAVRRYNGSGVNSYNYQALLLNKLLDGLEPEYRLDVPEQRKAIIQVEYGDDNILHRRPNQPPEARDKSQEERRRAAWDAHAAQFANLEALNPGRNATGLEQTMRLYRDALGAAFGDMNVIALGVHGLGLEAHAEHADESLLEDAKGALVGMAASHGLFIRQFEAWRDYLEDASPAPSDDTVESAVGVARVAWDADELIGRDVAEPLNALAEIARPGLSADPADRPSPAVQSEFLRSLGNVLSVSLAPFVKFAREAGGRARKGALDGVEESSKSLIKKASTAVALSAAAVTLAAQYPTLFGWLRHVDTFLRNTFGG